MWYWVNRNLCLSVVFPLLRIVFILITENKQKVSFLNGDTKMIEVLNRIVFASLYIIPIEKFTEDIIHLEFEFLNT